VSENEISVRLDGNKTEIIAANDPNIRKEVNIKTNLQQESSVDIPLVFLVSD